MKEERCKNERGAKRENRALSVFWLERNPTGKGEREGVRGGGYWKEKGRYF